jgi:two-component system response regulator PilR (NtrC family)
MPAMRERDGDLPILAQHFLDKFSREIQKDVRKISAYAMEVLGEYSFPGNVRELENIIERSVALETSNIVLPESLALSNFLKDRGRDERRHRDLTADGLNLDDIMAEIEREYLVKALDMANGSKQKAAELLGITFESFRYRLTKLNMT